MYRSSRGQGHSIRPFHGAEILVKVFEKDRQCSQHSYDHLEAIFVCTTCPSIDMVTVDQLKAQANTAYAAGKHADAVSLYTQ